MFGIFNKNKKEEQVEPIVQREDQPVNKAKMENRQFAEKPAVAGLPSAKLAQVTGGRLLRGTVASDKMNKTVVVTITNTRVHSKYQKGFKVTNRFKAHDENNEYKVGDRVIIQETRPLSKDKRWRVVSKF